MITTKEEAREIAFKYWSSHYGNITHLDDGEYLDGCYAFLIQSNYPIWNKDTKEVEGYIRMEKLGEIVVDHSGAITSATPRKAVITRIKKYQRENRK